MAKAKTKITKINGRFRIDVLDSHGKRHRPTFETKAEALAACERIAAKKSSGEFLAAGANTTFDKALDLLLERNVREGLAAASRLRVESIIKAHLRPAFGARKLSEFPAKRMRFVQEWLDERARNGAAEMSLVHKISYIKMALDEAIKAGLLGSPNPVTEFNLRAPRTNKREERAVLTLEEISKLISAASRRDHGEREPVFRVRFLLVLFGLLLGLRDQECGALCWDCVNFDERLIYVRRKIEKGAIVNSTKTGTKGFRTIPMSPILYAALLAYRDLLQSQGREVEGPVPILVPSRAEIVTQNAVMDHWDRLAKKAGFVDASWANDHSFYVLRHTCLNLWRTIDVRIDRLSGLAGHTNIHTTHSRYLHETPHFEVIRSEVHALGLEQTPAGLIDGLGFVLARRWRDEGIEIQCAPPRSQTPALGHNGSAKLLPGHTTIDMQPTAIAIEAPTAPSPGVNSLQALRAHQLKRAQELHAQGWTKSRISDELGVCNSAISDWIRTVPEPRWMRKAGRAERAELMARCAQLRDEHPTWSTTDIAKQLGVAPHRIVMWERKRGKPMPHRPGAHKVGKYDAQIREMVAQGKTLVQMAGRLGVSKSAIGYYLHRIGLAGTSKHRTSGVRIDLYADRIRELIAAGKSNWAIARELAEVSPSGIAGFIARNGLRAGAATSDESSERPVK